MNGKQLKNSILQWAIQGKLVPQDPNDEPASVLLEKIRQEKERLIKEKKIKRDKNASIIYRGEDNSYYEKFLATGEVKCIDEEIPFEIPKGWEWSRVSSVFLINPKVSAKDDDIAAFIPEYLSACCWDVAVVCEGVVIFVLLVVCFFCKLFSATRFSSLCKSSPA